MKPGDLCMPFNFEQLTGDKGPIGIYLGPVDDPRIDKFTANVLVQGEVRQVPIMQISVYDEGR